jgi:hypothetical protein
MAEGEQRFHDVETERMRARGITHKDRREQRFRGIKTWADENEELPARIVADSTFAVLKLGERE